MRNQVVALEHKAYGVVSVRIPVAVFILFRGNSVDNQIAAVVSVKPADDIEQRCFAAAART